MRIRIRNTAGNSANANTSANEDHNLLFRDSHTRRGGGRAAQLQKKLMSNKWAQGGGGVDKFISLPLPSHPKKPSHHC
jgi:hypothetical protein